MKPQKNQINELRQIVSESIQLLNNLEKATAELQLQQTVIRSNLNRATGILIAMGHGPLDSEDEDHDNHAKSFKTLTSSEGDELTRIILKRFGRGDGRGRVLESEVYQVVLEWCRKNGFMRPKKLEHLRPFMERRNFKWIRNGDTKYFTGFDVVDLRSIL